MKTKQEQIKAIKQIIDERVETALGQVQGRHDNVIKTVDTVIIARDIVEAGYCDVSEYKNRFEVADKVLTETKAKLTKAEHDRDRYKTEIERLKANISQAQDQILETAQKNQEYREQQIKQAKIDVLKELKKRSYTDNDFMDGKWHRYVLTNDIDEMIEELQK